jgi:hypothetical protein
MEQMNPTDTSLPRDEAQTDDKKLQEFGVGASSIGNRVYRSTGEQETQEQRLANQCESTYRTTHYTADTQGDDREGLRSADEPHQRKGTAPGEIALDKTVWQQENREELTSETEGRSLSRDIDTPDALSEG